MGKILIVDDEEPIRKLLSRIVAKRGFSCSEAADVDQARTLLLQESFELVFCDITMPGTSGVNLVKFVLKRFPDTPVIMVTVVNDPRVADDILRLGVYGYITKPFDTNQVLIQLSNALYRRELEIQNRNHQKQLEELVKERTAELNRIVQQLQEKERSLQEREKKFRSLFEHSNDVIVLHNFEGRIFDGNQKACDLLHYTREQLQQVSWDTLFPPREHKKVRESLQKAKRIGSIQFESRVQTAEGTLLIVEISSRVIKTEKEMIQSVIRDVTEQKQVETQLLHSQKLESIGQLAAGIAHEINTPMQYIGDNTRFFKESFSDLQRMLVLYEQLLQLVKQDSTALNCVEEIEALKQEIDLDYLLEEIPFALDQSLEGIERINTIVRSMKEFSHPPIEEKVNIDINKAIETTITIARNEWKYCAEMITDFDEAMPPVPGYPGDLNQVILNIIVNAAHAIKEVIGENSREKGTITISTRHDDQWAEIRIQDTGTGIKEDYRARIFDPFFTTKEVGKGTGQGLAIAHSIINEKHGGEITFETEVGKGTCFIIKLPLQTVGEEVEILE